MIDDRRVCGSCGGWLWTTRCLRTTCDLGALNRARDRRARARRIEIRRPPRLPYTRDGICRLCGGPVGKPRRTWCSDNCVHVWAMATSSDRARADLMAFYPGCWECGVLTDDVEVDHVVPLWNLTDDERLELKWWLPFNLELLCRRCHGKKTRREARRRAQIARSSGR